MCPREAASGPGKLFGNVLWEVIAGVAAAGGEPFWAASLARKIGRSDQQALRELDKLRELGIVVEVREGPLSDGPHVHHVRRLVASRSRLARAVLALPALFAGEADEHARGLGP
jgi:hypothetical protein